jgi:hypothetical protein
VLWGPTPAFRNIWWILVFAILLALGVAMLRRETEREFPGIERGGAPRLSRLAGLLSRGARPGAGLGRAEDHHVAAGLKVGSDCRACGWTTLTLVLRDSVARPSTRGDAISEGCCR